MKNNITLKISVAIMALSILSSTGVAGELDDAKELLKAWAPKSVKIEKSSLIVVLPQDQITEKIYLSVLTTGLCFGVMFDQTLPSVKEIKILNTHGKQGYVYEKGLEDCSDYNQRPVSNSPKIEILGNTHLF